MAIGDIPKFPKEFKPRGEKLVRLLQAEKISLQDVSSNVMSTLGVLRVGSSGFEMTGSFGSFEIDSNDFAALLESMNKMLDLVPILVKRLKGRELLIRVGDAVTKIRLSIPPKKARFSVKDIEETNMPVFEMPARKDDGIASGPLFEMFASYISDLDLSSSGKLINLKIRRADELVGWLGEGWDFMVELIDIATPAIQLTTKETLDRLGESYAAFWDDVLTKCGV